MKLAHHLRKLVELTQEINQLKYKLMEIFNEQFYEEIKRAVKDGIIEGFKEARSKRVKRDNLDLITTNEAFKIVSKARFYELITHAGLERVQKGSASNSPKYVSKAQLIRLNNTYKQPTA